ncbi:MAG TPA: hypothetical protein VG370_30405 [Chloroflexota bacterium]|jgi:hypothetical protein|nr:hypothetical protein [Chloroflexota bacterium]
MSSDPAAPAAQTVSVFDNLRPHKVVAEPATYEGREALRVTDAVLDGGEGNEDRLVVLEGSDFGDGTIEVEVSGEPGPGAFGQARGFVGVAFRVAADVSSFEAFYLRPTNGRAPDQVRRNHSVQYISLPDYPWHRSRQETPEKYESYCDLVPGAWTRVRIEVRGEAARLYVHGNEQPNLLVDDLKLGARTGLLGLWIGPGTLAHFANLRVTRG